MRAQGFLKFDSSDLNEFHLITEEIVTLFCHEVRN